MTDYIKREDAINELCRRGCETERSGKLVVSMCEAKQFAVDVIGDVPAADVRENVRGRWIVDEKESPNGVDWCHCSVCGRKDITQNISSINFCPNCGANMAKSFAKNEAKKYE